MIKIASMVGAPDLCQETLAIFSGDLEAACEKLAQFGFDGVEIMTRDPRLLDGEKIKSSLENQGLDLVGLCTGHVFAEDKLGLVGLGNETGNQTFDRLQHFIDFASQYGSKETMVNIGRTRGPGYPSQIEQTKKEMGRSFWHLAEYAASHGIRLVLEPINKLQTEYIHSTQDGIAMVEEVNHPNFGLMVDTFHMNIEDVDIYQSLRQAKPCLWFIHFSDNNRHWPGSAHIDFERIIAVLEEIEYHGYVSMEIEPWPDPETAAKSTIQSLHRYIKYH